MCEYENLDNYQSNLEDNIELRKAVSKLEDLLTKKHFENDNLMKMHQEFKILNEKTRKECTDLNEKLIQLYTERNYTEKKYESEIQRLKNYFEKQKEVYEAQILRLSSHDTESLKNKITAEVEMNHKHFLQQKDNEIEELQSESFEWKKKYELLITEYETVKIDSQREVDFIKENNKAEIKDLLYKIQLLNEKSESNVDREGYKNLRQEFEAYRKNFTAQHTEVINLRKEKELILSEKNEIKINLYKELDQERLKCKINYNDNEKLIQTVKNNEIEIENLKEKLEEKNEEIKQLINDKFILTKELRIQESEFENFKGEIRVLRAKVQEREKEYEDTLKVTHEKEKERYLNTKTENEEAQKKIEELSNKLREVQIDFKNFFEKSNEELHSTKRDFYIVQEEKRNLIRRISEVQKDADIFREDYEKTKKEIDHYQNEYSKLDSHYREICSKEADNYKAKVTLESQLSKKDDEISHLSNLLKVYEKNSLVKVEQTSQYKLKYESLLKKKKYYKKQVR